MSEAKPVVNISIDPVAGTLRLTRGSLVAGMNHALQMRNTKGEWRADGEYSLVVKEWPASAVIAAADKFEISESDPRLLTANLDLFTLEVMELLDSETSASVYLHLIDKEHRESYGPPVQVTIYGTAHRDTDLIPPSGMPPIEIDTRWKLVVDENGQIMVEERNP